MTFISITPMYYDQFRCIGQDCPDTCCTGSWRIYVDRKSIEKYEALPESEFKKDLADSIKKNPDAKHSWDYAEINLTRDRLCPMLTPECFCRIQLELGSDCLHLTCRKYPRIRVKYGNRIEKSLSLSCPEAARLVLLDTEPISFVTRQEILEESPENTQNDDWEPLFQARFKEAAFDILQNSSQLIEERLYRLGQLCKNIEAERESSETKSVPDRLTATWLREASSVSGLTTHPPDLSAQLQAFGNLADFSFRCSRWPRYRELGTVILTGLRLELHGNSLQVNSLNVLKYKEAIHRYYHPLVNRYPYLFENLLVTLLLSKKLEGESLVSGVFVELLLIFGLIRVMLAGWGAAHSRLTEEDAVTVIYNAIRNLINSNSLIQIKIYQMQKSGNFNMDYFENLLWND